LSVFTQTIRKQKKETPVAERLRTTQKSRRNRELESEMNMTLLNIYYAYRLLMYQHFVTTV
jgi:hypothetical protein